MVLRVFDSRHILIDDEVKVISQFLVAGVKTVHSILAFACKVLGRFFWCSLSDLVGKTRVSNFSGVLLQTDGFVYYDFSNVNLSKLVRQDFLWKVNDEH